MKIEFLINEVIETEGELIVRGICNKGNIGLGAIFSEVNDCNGTVRNVDLRVGKIIAYRREIDLLPRGMSGEIHFYGNEFSKIGHGDMLCD